MPKVLCRCGKEISLHAIPCPNEWLIISDVVYDRISETPIDPEVLYREMQTNGEVSTLWNAGDPLGWNGQAAASLRTTINR
jgi:hypothetical protein